jgi:methionine biosynthesis protein MetW
MYDSNIIRKVAVKFGLKKIAPASFNWGLNETTKMILDLLEENPNASVLDVGCGNGDNTMKYAAKIKTKNIHGIEIVEELVWEAQSKGIHVYIADLNKKWPVKSQEFDVIIANQVIEHLWNTRLFISECFRVLKPFGYAIVATENLASWPNILSLLFGYQPFSTTNICGYSLGNPLIWHLDEQKNTHFFEKYKNIGGGGPVGHVRVLAYKTFKDIFSLEGFKTENFRAVGYIPFTGRVSRLFSRLDPRHAHFMVIKVRKT